MHLSPRATKLNRLRVLNDASDKFHGIADKKFLEDVMRMRERDME